jgi:nucleoside-diphosphate-sugar epimerase
MGVQPVKILLTGSNGYIGSVMGPVLENAGHEVVRLDTGYFSNCRFIKDEPHSNFIRKDIRDIDGSELSGINAVVHLAALSNDPIGNLREEWTRSINLDATIRLAWLARKAGVARFLFASSCIMYGSSNALEVTEETPLAPATEYARSKAAAEVELRKVATADFSPIYIRNGTVYGTSPRMRFDTVLNNFMGQAVATGKVVVFSNGEPWRPVVHVEDVCRTFVAYLRAPRNAIHNEAFNNGADILNYRIRDLAGIVVRAVAGTQLEIRNEAGADQRTYKANFDKFRRTFPDFRFLWDPVKGANELRDKFRRINVDAAMFEAPEFTRLKWLNKLLLEKKIDGNLRWTHEMAFGDV